MSFNYTSVHTILLACALFLPTSIPAAVICEEPLAHMLHIGLHPYLVDKDFSAQRDSVRQFYQLNQQQLAWYHEGQLSSQGHSLVGRFSSSGIIDLEESIQVTSQSNVQSRCQLSLYDIALTIVGLRHLQSLQPRAPQPADQLLALSRQPWTTQQLSKLEPEFPVYVQLQQALQTYRRLASAPSLSMPLPAHAKSLRPGDPYPAMKQLIDKLRRWGDLDSDPAYFLDSEIYAKELLPAVKQFQTRHGLNADGIVGEKTFKALNVSMTERVRQIELSLLRWRELPLDEKRMLVVNIPQYKLFAFERIQDTYTQTLDMKVIVGKSKRKHQTPVMSGEMTHIVFAPYWNIPYKILRDELYPEIITDPEYLTSNGYQIVPGFSANAKVLTASEENLERLLSGELKLRQINGKINALGSAKFIFPNQHSVYMHGTPTMSLFKRGKRAFSHGCVRLADPLALAEYVLDPEHNWSRKRIDNLVHSGKRKVVSLSEPLPVHMMYATAVADADGKVYFAQDVYRLEQQQQLVSAR